jgi:uncharacterized protein YegJ (DUF2314 family)
MTGEFNILDFAGLSKEQPWELDEPTPTDFRCVLQDEEKPSMDAVTKAIATFVGEAIDVETVESPEESIDWVVRLRIPGIPIDLLVWAEPLTKAVGESAGVASGSVLAVQTVLHKGDPLTHFANIMRVLAGSDLHVHSICDIPTGRWFSSEFLQTVFINDEIEPQEEVLWITRLVEAPENVEPEDRWAWVSTFGLARCGRFELEMLGVSGSYSTEAVRLVDSLAALTLETPLPPTGKPLSIGTNLLVSLVTCEKAVALLQEEMPGSEDRALPSVAIVHSDGNTVCPLDALLVLHQGETAVNRSLRSTERSATIAQNTWNLLLQAANQIGQNEHAGCLVQVPWEHAGDESEQREYLWFRVVEVRGSEVVGELAHSPDIVTTLREGQKETITKQDITDWILLTPVGPMGPIDSSAIAEFLTQFKS